MKELQSSHVIRVFSWDELDSEQKNLFLKAARARENAQAPYSGYMVGVAIKSASGKIYTGCNVERVTYSETSHAEQVAIDKMVSEEGPNKVAVLAGVSGPKGQEISFWPKVNLNQASLPTLDDFWFPCGRCRQIIWENSFADPDVPVFWFHPSGLFAQTRIRDLLPNHFGPKNLGIDYGKKDRREGERS